MSAEENSLAKSGEERSWFRNSDRFSGIVLVLVAAFAVYEASRLPFGSIRAPDAGFFPITLSVLLLVVAVVIALRSFISVSERPQFTTQSWYVALAAIALVIYALVLQTLGFLLATVIIMLLMMRGFGGMSWKRAVLIAVPAVFVSYLAFLELGVPLPRGFLPF